MRTTSRPRILLAESNEDGTTGGSYRCLHDIAVHLDRTRYEPVCLFYRENWIARRLADAGVETEDWTQLRTRERRVFGQARSFAERTVVRAGIVARRARFLRRARIDLVHANNSPNVVDLDWLPAAIAAGVPIVSHVRGPVVRVEGRALNLMYRRFSRLIAISRTVQSQLASTGYPAERTELLYDGIDIAALRRAADAPHRALRDVLHLPADAFVAVMVGHVQEWKGQHVAVEALRLLPVEQQRRVHLVFVGGVPEPRDSYMDELQRASETEALAGRVHFLGERDDVPAIVSDADVLIHASTLPEPLGLVVLEGMALGVPVIASRLGGPSETVTTDAGLLFDPAQPAELAAYLARLVKDPALRASLADGGTRRVRAFDIAEHVARLEQLYDEVLAPARSSRPTLRAPVQPAEARA